MTELWIALSGVGGAVFGHIFSYLKFNKSHDDTAQNNLINQLQEQLLTQDKRIQKLEDKLEIYHKSIVELNRINAKQEKEIEYKDLRIVELENKKGEVDD